MRRMLSKQHFEPATFERNGLKPLQEDPFDFLGRGARAGKVDVDSKNSAHQTESSSSLVRGLRSVWSIYVRIGDCAQQTSSR
jgi:hypothetical protein